MLLLLPFVRRAVRGAAGAGCGRSRGFRLLNLYDPYEASLFGRAADAVDETEGFERLAGSFTPGRVGSRDLERTAGRAGAGPPPGERSNLSARALTLLGTWGDERVDEADGAGPEADLGVALGGERAPFVVVWRWRVVAAMSGAWFGGGPTCWSVEA